MKLQISPREQQFFPWRCGRGEMQTKQPTSMEALHGLGVLVLPCPSDPISLWPWAALALGYALNSPLPRG